MNVGVEIRALLRLGRTEWVAGKPAPTFGNRTIVSGDFTRLGPEVMLSRVALSLTDTILEKKAPPARRRAAKRRKTAGARR